MVLPQRTADTAARGVSSASARRQRHALQLRGVLGLRSSSVGCGGSLPVSPTTPLGSATWAPSRPAPSQHLQQQEERHRFNGSGEEGAATLPPPSPRMPASSANASVVTPAAEGADAPYPARAASARSTLSASASASLPLRIHRSLSVPGTGDTLARRYAESASAPVSAAADARYDARKHRVHERHDARMLQQQQQRRRRNGRIARLQREERRASFPRNEALWLDLRHVQCESSSGGGMSGGSGGSECVRMRRSCTADDVCLANGNRCVCGAKFCRSGRLCGSRLSRLAVLEPIKTPRRRAVSDAHGSVGEDAMVDVDGGCSGRSGGGSSNSSGGAMPAAAVTVMTAAASCANEDVCDAGSGTATPHSWPQPRARLARSASGGVEYGVADLRLSSE